MYDNRSVKLCYTPMYNLAGTYICCYLNTRSLHAHFDDVASNYNILSCDVIILAETRLNSTDTDTEYKLEGYTQMYRNDQCSQPGARPPHGLIAYVKDGISILQTHKISSAHFETVHMCIHRPGEKEITQVIGIYISPASNWNSCINSITELLKEIDIMDGTTVILGDFNMKSLISSPNYNQKIIGYFEDNYNMLQFINMPTTNNASTLDLCFSSSSVSCTSVWNHWSDHRTIAIAINS